MSVWNLILCVLNHVVSLAAPTERALLNDAQHVLSCLFLRCVRHETVAKLLDRLTAKTRQARVEHQRHQTDDRFSVRPKNRVEKESRCSSLSENFVKPQSQVSLHAEFFKPAERRRVDTSAHDEHHLIGKFHVWFPPEVASRRTFKHEAKI